MARMTPRQRLDALAEMLVPDLRSAFLASIQGIVNNNVLINALIASIEAGDIEGAFRAIGYSDAAMRPLTAAIERAFEQGGIFTGETFPRWLNTPSGKARFVFDVRKSRAEAWVRDHSSRLITQIGEDIRDNIRTVLYESNKAGINPRTIALDIVGRVDKAGARVGGLVGLTSQQQKWVENTRLDLVNLDERYFSRELRDARFDRTVAKAIRDGKPLDKATIDKLVLRYKANALKYRGETIARTEALQSLNRSEYEAVLQARDMGAINESATKRVWDSAGDSRVRWSHRKLDEQAVGIDEPFVSPSGSRMMHPGDTSLGASGNEVIMCRCRARLKVDWLDDLD